MKKPADILYVVQIFQSPLWRDYLPTHDKAKAEAALKEIIEAGENGRIEEIPQRKKTRPAVKRDGPD